VIPELTRVFYLFHRLPGDIWRTNLPRRWRSRGNGDQGLELPHAARMKGSTGAQTRTLELLFNT